MDRMSHVQIRDQRELESASSILMTLINENRNNTQIEEQSNKESDMTILEKLRNQYLVLSETHNVPYDFDDTLTPDYVKYYSSDNYAIQLMSVSIGGAGEKRSLFQRNTFQFPHWDLPAWEKARKLWGENRGASRIRENPFDNN
ncbi:unnamed protein product [Lepeophtheirus salmonis]|uniref:(salmon louse) hypothetical protein n=1 Tax=Lepeophtheirus salmonis TaxID=72036 RepID=A0A7R8CM59_LEPSM|nr:unnamed protein product [Lepeophtheirus salmonis]CAF2859964.1 unnamed protein product [Lepeophtheirus salmonis]